jgi:hypothetical protein
MRATLSVARHHPITRIARRCCCISTTTTAVAHSRDGIVEYVRLEEHANVNHEFLDGTVWAMAS